MISSNKYFRNIININDYFSLLVSLKCRMGENDHVLEKPHLILSYSFTVLTDFESYRCDYIDTLKIGNLINVLKNPDPTVKGMMYVEFPDINYGNRVTSSFVEKCDFISIRNKNSCSPRETVYPLHVVELLEKILEVNEYLMTFVDNFNQNIIIEESVELPLEINSNGEIIFTTHLPPSTCFINTYILPTAGDINYINLFNEIISGYDTSDIWYCEQNNELVLIIKPSKTQIVSSSFDTLIKKTHNPSSEIKSFIKEIAKDIPNDDGIDVGSVLSRFKDKITFKIYQYQGQDIVDDALNQLSSHLMTL